MTDVRQLDYEASREEWRRLNGLPGARPGFGGRGDKPRLEAGDGRLRAQMRVISAEHEQSENLSLREAPFSATLRLAPSAGAAR